MPRLRIALAQIDSTVGDLEGNSAAIIEWTRRAADRGAHLVVFPEMLLTGYPVEDLVLRASFVDASIEALAATAAGSRPRGSAASRSSSGTSTATRLAAAVGQPAKGAAGRGGAAARGPGAGHPAKHHLPNYGVFDEYRYFIPATGCRCSASAARQRPSTWPSPSARTCGRTAGRSPSPGGRAPGCWSCPTPRRTSGRRTTYGWRCAQRRAREAGCALAYVNQVGGQDELVFDGDSIIVDASGELLARAAAVREELLVADLDLPTAGPGAPSGRPGRGRARRHDDEITGSSGLDCRAAPGLPA